MEKADVGANIADVDVKLNQPPLTPVKTKKATIVPNVTMFRTIDENARNVPDSVLLSVEKLVAHLCKVATTDIEKVRAFYVWICNNIGSRSKKEEGDVDPSRSDAVSTLRQRRGSHVNLLSALCKEASIPVVTIHGCSKGLHSDREFSVGESNHSWNAVHVAGEWRLIDCLWGSGYIDTNGTFQQKMDEFWFLTDPDVFVYDHFPSESAWQLLDKPIDIEEFNKKPNISKRSRELGLRLISHKEPTFLVEKEVTIQFSTEICPLSTITADLLSVDGEKVNSHRCITRIDKQTFEIRVVPPQIGQYSLRLYGKTRDYIHAKFKQLIEYTLRVEAVSEEKVVFPNHFKAWGPEPNYAEYGFASSIEKMSTFATDRNEMTIQLDQSRKNTISPELLSETDSKEDMQNYTMVSAYAEGITVHCRFPTAGYYKLNVYAKGPDNQEHELNAYLIRNRPVTMEFCASFLIECTATDTPKMYPESSSSAVFKHECELLEPLGRELPSESVVSFRLKSADLREAKVSIPKEEKFQGNLLQQLGELTCTGNIFSGLIKTPAKGETVVLCGAKVTPSTVMTRIYEFVTV